MIAKVVHDEFFAVRFIDDPTDTSWGNKRKIKQGTKFQDMVFEAAKPILQRLANEWAVKNADVIADHWRKVTDAGLMQYVEKLQADVRAYLSKTTGTLPTDKLGSKKILKNTNSHIIAMNIACVLFELERLN